MRVLHDLVCIPTLRETADRPRNLPSFGTRILPHSVSIPDPFGNSWQSRQSWLPEENKYCLYARLFPRHTARKGDWKDPHGGAWMF